MAAKAKKKVVKKQRGVTKAKPARRVTSKRGRPTVGAGNGKPRLTAKKQAEQAEAEKTKARVAGEEPTGVFAAPAEYLDDSDSDPIDEYEYGDENDEYPEPL